MKGSVTMTNEMGSVTESANAGEDRDFHDLFRGVRDGRERVGRENREGLNFGQPLFVFMLGGNRFPDEDAA